MPNEDFERAISFLLQSQANHEARLAQQRADFERRFASLTEAQSKTQRQLELTDQAVVAVAGYLQQSIQLSNDRMDKLAAVHAETAERLNAFIVVVEKYITKHGNGSH